MKQYLDDIINEIDSWDIQIEMANGATVSYANLIKPIYYGIGIDVTKKIIERLENSVEKPSEYYFNFDLKTALKLFRRDFVAWHYERNDFDSEKTGRKLGITGHPGLQVARIFRDSGTNINEVKRALERKESLESDGPMINFHVDNKELLEYARDEIKKYTDVMNSTLLRTQIKRYDERIAERFVDIAKKVAEEAIRQNSKTSIPIRYIGLAYKEAGKHFKKDYMIHQFYKSDQNTIEAAKRCGMTNANYRATLKNFNVYIRDLTKRQNN